jgi:hypothetical protein
MRHVVDELPKTSVQVQPSEAWPHTTSMEPNPNWRLDSGLPTVIEVDHPWHLDSNTARLLGEAKSMPDKRPVKFLTSDLVSSLDFVAWYANRKGCKLLQYKDYCYFVRK